MTDEPVQHHSAQQVREDDGRWRPTPGYAHADHARPVPDAKTQLMAAQAAGTLAMEVDSINADIARMFALPAELIRSR